MANPMSTSQDFANWICGPSLDPEFLMHALICSRSELRAISEGATHKTIYMPALESFHLCAPELSEQRRIVKNLRETLDKIAGLHVSLEQQRSELKQLPQRIFAQAFES
jgi:type I restriction enzyme S subunit